MLVGLKSPVPDTERQLEALGHAGCLKQGVLIANAEVIALSGKTIAKLEVC